jgi:hypothetical protein
MTLATGPGGRAMARKMRTAVLCVHGIGSQRPLETVRGIINAVWFDHDDHKKDKKKLWSHPEPSGVDLDLTVMTTSSISGKRGGRMVDLHELYWAHQMSETKAVAVLLWLFELGRQGPRMNRGMNPLWYGASIFLALLHISAAMIVLQAIAWFARVATNPEWMVYAPVLMLFVAFAATALAALLALKLRLAFFAAALAAAIVVLYLVAKTGPVAWGWPVTSGTPAHLTNIFLPVVIATIAILLVMGKWGLLAMLIAYSLSWAFFGIFIRLAGYTDLAAVISLWNEGRVPWSLLSPASMVAACAVIGVYLIINGWFLEPYLGDAARYFRNSPANVAVRRAIRKNAVDTLANLHACGYYDRIIVVAHSLGSVVAYDMLRAYYSRICDWAPLLPSFDPELTRIDRGGLSRAQLRKDGRELMRKMARAQKKVTPLRARESSKGPQAWLVTDFVTLGAALKHAKFLMCHGRTRDELENDFSRRVEEREFPTCPPHKDPPDGWLAYTDPNSNKKRLHHGGLFALTRWTNIYFPLKQVFWGDAIGGPLVSVFGSHIEDKEVWTNSNHSNGVFTHTKYWDTKFDQDRQAPHIVALREAVDLADQQA